MEPAPWVPHDGAGGEHRTKRYLSGFLGAGRGAGRALAAGRDAGGQLRHGAGQERPAALCGAPGGPLLRLFLWVGSGALGVEIHGTGSGLWCWWPAPAWSGSGAPPALWQLSDGAGQGSGSPSSSRAGAGPGIGLCGVGF